VTPRTAATVIRPYLWKRMYVEQKLARCAACGAAFSVLYDCAHAAADRAPPQPFWVRCPHADCGRPNAVPLPSYAYPLVAKPILGPLSAPPPATAHRK
jgi:hypothetical protein